MSTYMDPAQSQQTVVVLETEELLYILHITVVWASWLLGNHHMGQQKLILSLEETNTSHEYPHTALEVHL